MSLVANMETKFSGSSKMDCPPSPCFKHKGLLSSRGSEKPVNSLSYFCGQAAGGVFITFRLQTLTT